MSRQRRERLLDAMAGNDIDALVLTLRAGVTYATGSFFPLSDSSRDFAQPEVAAVLRDGSTHLFTPAPDDFPAGPHETVLHAPLSPDSEVGVRHMAAELRTVLGPALTGKVGFDDYTPAMFTLPELLGEATFVDAAPTLSQARMVKTADEIECVKAAQAMAEIAMFDVLQALRPGVRQNELSGILLERLLSLGCTGNHFDPVWMVVPDRLSDGPMTSFHDLAIPLPSTDQVFQHGDVIMVDASIDYLGYHGDFGRTWLCSLDSRPAGRLLDQFKLWSEVFEAVRAEARPGKTGGDLTRAAVKAAKGRKRWPPNMWLAHGMGLVGAEYPLIGTTLGEAYDESVVLAPGMCLVIEPSVFDDGVGGYRSEDLLVVTEGEAQLFRHFPYWPWGS